MRIGSADTVVIETLGTVMSPVVGLRLQVGCENPVTRDFVVLGEGVQLPGELSSASSAAAAPATPAVAPAPGAARPAVTPIPPAAAPVARPQRVQRAAAAERATPRTPAAPAPRAAATAPRATAAAPAAQPAPATAAASSDTSRRIAELQARSDDHAAALLALDDRLALLQKQADVLKAQLAQVLATLPDSAATSAQPPAAAARPAPAAASATAPASPAPTAAATPPAPASIAAPSSPSAPAPQASADAAARSAPDPQKGQGVFDLLTDWRVAGGLGLLLLGALAFKLRRRPTFKPADAPVTAPAASAWPKSLTDTQPVAARGAMPAGHDRTQAFRAGTGFQAANETAEWHTSTQPIRVDQTAEWVPPPTTDSLPVPFGEAATTTQPRLPGAGITREHHITQQFQPAAERVVALSSPEEIVQQARTHYMEDGDVFRAIDLLEMAISARKDSTRPWQALFAIYRRENMPERFQRLVLAYRSAFGQDESWPAIRTLGKAIDSTNPLYSGDAPLEPIPEDLVERWLGVPLDFTAHLLANEMHDQLMDTFPGRKRRKRMARE